MKKMPRYARCAMAVGDEEGDMLQDFLLNAHCNDTRVDFQPYESNMFRVPKPTPMLQPVKSSF